MMSSFVVLLADDDEDDRFLTEQACLAIRSCGGLRFVEDGEELMHYLRRSGKYADDTLFPLPSLILLDLNMPRKNGRQVLVEIKSDPYLHKIPVVIWTTSRENEDKSFCREAGADIFVTKPPSFPEWLANIRKVVVRYSSK